MSFLLYLVLIYLLLYCIFIIKNVILKIYIFNERLCLRYRDMLMIFAINNI